MCQGLGEGPGGGGAWQGRGRQGEGPTGAGPAGGGPGGGAGRARRGRGRQREGPCGGGASRGGPGASRGRARGRRGSSLHTGRLTLQQQGQPQSDSLSCCGDRVSHHRENTENSAGHSGGLLITVTGRRRGHVEERRKVSQSPVYKQLQEGQEPVGTGSRWGWGALRAPENLTGMVSGAICQNPPPCVLKVVTVLCINYSSVK